MKQMDPSPLSPSLKSLEGKNELLPCPFCGCDLMPNNNQDDLYVRRYGTYYQHPINACYLSDDEVSPSNRDEWNTRQSSGVQTPGNSNGGKGDARG